MAENKRPVKSPTLTASRTLAAALIRQLLDGRHPAGMRLPTERDMALQHHVSRHVVREALKHLEALGLIEIQQGSGVYAKDVLLTGGLELFEYLLFNKEGRFDSGALCDLVVFCRLFVPNVLRLAAINRTAEQLAELEEAVRLWNTCENDPTMLITANMLLLRIISRATHNTIYQLLFNNVGRLITRLRTLIPFEQLEPVMTLYDLEDIYRAIKAQDADLAGLLAQRLAERAQNKITDYLASVSNPDICREPAHG